MFGRIMRFLTPQYHLPVRFDFRWIPAAATVLGIVLFVYLGAWQSGKGERLEAALAARDARHALGAVRVGSALVDAGLLHDAPIVVRGFYEAQGQFFVDNRQLDGQPGLHVITPLRIDGGQTRILVNRGWTPWPHGRGNLPVVDVPGGPVAVAGHAFVPSTKRFFLMPEQKQDAQLWPRIDLARYASQSGQIVQPVVLLQKPDDASDALVRRWDPPENRVAKHRAYAFQWFGMAAALLVFYLVASLRKKVQK